MFDKFMRSMRQTPRLDINVGKHSAHFTGVPALIAGGAIGVGLGKVVRGASTAIRSRRSS